MGAAKDILQYGVFVNYLWVLKASTEASGCNLGRRYSSDTSSEEFYLSRRLHEATNRVQHRRFTSAIGADYGN